jgi:hypothetical protein
MIGHLREELDEVQRYFKMRENDLHRTEEERNTHRSAVGQEAKEVEQLRVALQGKDGELQQEHAALGEVRSQIALKDTVKPYIFIENPNHCTIAIVSGSVAITYRTSHR